ncbi:OmpA family protein [Haliscomenobacter sp.]|uniref:OmpA family protein n=1 Tax=Haliscomenobacter sp. TaxID=2717303 RepID=UPI003364F9EA
MKSLAKLIVFCAICFSLSSCVMKKQYLAMQTDLKSQLDAANKDLGKLGVSLNEYMSRLAACEKDKERLGGDIRTNLSTLQLREEQINDLKAQINDLKNMREKQLNTVTDLTTLSKSANDNIKETLSQLEKKDKYIQLLQAARTRADSINLALSVNLKGVLKEGLDDKDVDVKVDKTVVFVNLSDKMLFQSGSAVINTKANDVLGKIAKIILSRPDLEVMVEGYTDNKPIKTACLDDNWDLSVKRATAVVRALQKNHNVDPNRLIAAGRGEFNALVKNDTEEGRSTNRRTRIIILPKLDQFYDLLNPTKVPN